MGRRDVVEAVSMIVPLPPVVQRALDNVALRVTSAEGTSSIRYYEPGTAGHLLARYGRPTTESGLRWQVERTEE